MTYTIRITAPKWTTECECSGDRVVKSNLGCAYRMGARRLKAWARSKGFKVEQFA